MALTALVAPVAGLVRVHIQGALLCEDRTAVAQKLDAAVLIY
jgi:hypothetical protein